MKRRDSIIALIIALGSLVACRKEAQPAAGEPLVFSAEQTKAGLSSYYESFLVWGYCLTDSGTDIMPGYKVFHDAALGWSYTSLPGTEGQELQYWSYSASLFRFHAGAPLERVKSIGSSELTLEMKATTSLSETSLFSEPYVVNRSDVAFGNTVNLDFVYANARLNLAFKCASSVAVSISGISLTPPAPYATKAEMQLSYDWTRPAVRLASLSTSEQSSEPLAFPDVQVPAGSSAAVQTASPWYLIPQSSAKGQWKLSMSIDGVVKEVEFTLSKGWEAGKSYLYRFEYTNEANLVFLGTTTELFIGENPEDGGNHNFS